MKALRWFPPLLWLILGACATAPDSASFLIVGRYCQELKIWLPEMPCSSTWTWTDSRGHTGQAVLDLHGLEYRWTLLADPHGPLVLAPSDSTWLSIEADSLADLAEVPPLPILPLESNDYPHLVDFLRQLTRPLTGSRVTHWPSRPIAVSGPGQTDGAVDLSGCLREAMSSWNQGTDGPWFVWREEQDDAPGIRLVHHAGVLTRPAMSLSLVRRGSEGCPEVMNLNVGDNYDRPTARPYVVRAMVHELAHALLLWGHSTDRGHVLWGSAPPLRSDPSSDERRGAQLWRRLPPGLDLNRYGVTPPG